MFCPNCGTKNQDSVEKCTQCGFDLGKKAAPRFKGTMMAGASPFANQSVPGGAPAPTTPAAPAEPARASAAMKGTMVGVAPPNIAELRKQMESVAAAQETAAAPKPSAAMKGTMVGVAPPGIEELRKQMAQASAPAEPAAPQPSAPAPAAAVSKPQLKGTMIGVAPPNIAELRKQLDSQNAATAAAPAPQPQTSAPAPQVSTPAAPAGAATSAAPSKLKGTMIGVAPPDVSALLAKGKAAEAANTPTEPAPPPVDPTDAFGGTVVGTSPFAPGGQFADRFPEKSADSGTTVPSPPEDEAIPERRSDRPEAFAATRISEPPVGGAFDDRTPAANVAPNAPSAVTYSPPKSKGSNSAVVVLVLAVVAILAIVAFLVTR